MTRRSGRRLALGAAGALCAWSQGLCAAAGDFLSALFGAFGGGRSHAPSIPLPFVPFGGEDPRPRASYSGGGGQAYCVRTCDGRYFPISAPDSQTRAASCNNFCPASDTKVVYGSS